MSGVRKKGVTSISGAKSIEEIAEFWDTHSLADYWDATRQVSFTVRATRRRRITIDPAAYSEIEVVARQRGISAETLVNLWIAEHLGKGRKGQQAARRGAHSRRSNRVSL